MKKILIISGLALVLSAAAVSQSAYATGINPIETNAKVQTAFDTYFPHAVNVSWFEKDNAFIVHFGMPDGKYTAQFDKKGHLTYTLIYHYNTDLPQNIRLKLEQAYKGMKATNVVEYTDNNSHLYFVMLENSTQLLRVKISDLGEPITVEKLTKA